MTLQVGNDEPDINNIFWRQRKKNKFSFNCTNSVEFSGFE